MEDNGNKYLVLLDEAHQEQIFLIKADEGGMQFLLGKKELWIIVSVFYLAYSITATYWELKGEKNQEFIPMLKENIRTAYLSTGNIIKI